MTIDIEALRLAADAVTRKRWLIDGRTVYTLNEQGVNHFYATVQGVHADDRDLAAVADFIGAANPSAVLELLRQLEVAEKDRDHWKANHETEVKRARVLKDRTDMPLERVKAYEYIGELVHERNVLQKISAQRADALEYVGLRADCTLTEAKLLRIELSATNDKLRDAITELRLALGDDGIRRLPELVEFARGIVAERDALRGAAEQESEALAFYNGWMDRFKIIPILHDASMTDEWNSEHRFYVERSAPPFCDKDGNRVWLGRTPSIALSAARAALGLFKIRELSSGAIDSAME